MPGRILKVPCPIFTGQRLDKEMKLEKVDGKQPHAKRQVENLIRLVKRGDAASLAQVRQELGETAEEVAAKLGIPAERLIRWENGSEDVRAREYIRWKLKMSYMVDTVIAELLGTEDTNTITQFWELMWELVD